MESNVAVIATDHTSGMGPIPFGHFYCGSPLTFPVGPDSDGTFTPHNEKGETISIDSSP